MEIILKSVIIRILSKRFPSFYRFITWARNGWRFKEDVRAYGLPTALRVVCEVLSGYALKRPLTCTKYIKVGDYPNHIHYRPGTSDLQVIKQMLVFQFYRPLAQFDPPFHCRLRREHWGFRPVFSLGLSANAYHGYGAGPSQHQRLPGKSQTLHPPRAGQVCTVGDMADGLG